MNFQEALTLMQEGKYVTRECWKDNTRYTFIYPEVDNINLQYMVGNLYRNEQCSVGSYTHMSSRWLPTQDDLFAEDWKIAK